MAATNTRLALAITIVRSRAAPMAIEGGAENAGCSHGGGDKIEIGDDERAKLKGKWKREHRKVKRLEAEAAEMRGEISKLRSDLLECFVPNVLCACFAKNAGSPLEIQAGNAFLGQDTSLHFLDCVRILNKKRRLVDDDLENDDRASRVAKIAEFIVELVADARGEELTSVWLHQAVEFVKDAVAWLSRNEIPEEAKSAIKSFITKLVSRLASYDPANNPDAEVVDHRSCTQKVILELAAGVPLIGQSLLLVATKQLHLIAEAISQADPFRRGVAQVLENAYFIIETIEKVCIEPLSSWIKSDKLDKPLLEEFVSDFFRMKAALIGSGQTCLLLVVYVDRACAQIVKQLHLAEHRDTQLHGCAMQHLVTMACNATSSTRS